MRMSAAEYRETSKRNKYGAKKTMLDGITFDSKAEARYYAQLKQREKAGEVHSVELQRPYVLSVDGFLIATYKADFSFWDHVEERQRVIDVKRVVTPVFRLKQKMMKAIYGIDIEVVK
nr:DUF1064 domain-containing protein [Brucella anthropi]